ncbi:unnamed protein product, partial [Rotaria sordida]
MVNQPFSIDAKTNYLVQMFRAQVTVEYYGFIHKNYFVGARKSTDKALRLYRLSSNHFLLHENYTIREYDHLLGHLSIPDLAANDKYEYFLDLDPDIIFEQSV